MNRRKFLTNLGLGVGGVMAGASMIPEAPENLWDKFLEAGPLTEDAENWYFWMAKSESEVRRRFEDRIETGLLENELSQYQRGDHIIIKDRYTVGQSEMTEVQWVKIPKNKVG